MSNLIISLFPGELKEHYFQKAYIDKSDNKKISARGILYEKYRSERKQALVLGYFVKRQSTKQALGNK